MPYFRKRSTRQTPNSSAHTNYLHVKCCEQMDEEEQYPPKVMEVTDDHYYMERSKKKLWSTTKQFQENMHTLHFKSEGTVMTGV